MSSPPVFLCILFLLCRPVVPLKWIEMLWSSGSYGYLSKYVDEGYSWYEARRICESGGGDLLVVGRYLNFIGHVPSSFNRSDHFWTRFNKVENIDDWWPYSYPVKQEDPNEYKKCVGARMAFGERRIREVHSWESFNCGNHLPWFICEQSPRWRQPRTHPPPVITHSNCPQGWRDAGTNRCYKDFKHPTRFYWKTAEATCRSLPYYKPTLACANSRQEIEILTRIVTYPYRAQFWFGLFREKARGPWMWADNSEFVKNVTNFHHYLNKMLDYGGGLIDNRAIPRGSWDVASDRDGLNALLRRYICQVEKDPHLKHTSLFSDLVEYKVNETLGN